MIYPCYDVKDCVHVELLKDLFPGRITETGFVHERKTVQRIPVESLFDFSQQVRKRYEEGGYAELLEPDPEIEAVPTKSLSPGVEWGLTAYAGYEPPYTFSHPDFSWRMVKMPPENDPHCPIQ